MYKTLVGEICCFIDSIYTRKLAELQPQYRSIVNGVKNVMRAQYKDVFANWHIHIDHASHSPAYSPFIFSLDASGPCYKTVSELLDLIMHGSLYEEDVMIVAFMELALRDEPFCMLYKPKRILSPSPIWHYDGNDIVIKLE